MKSTKEERNLTRKTNLECTCSNCSNCLSKSDFLWSLHTGTGRRILSMEGLSVVCWHFHLILFQYLKKSMPFNHFSPFTLIVSCFSWSRQELCSREISTGEKGDYQTMEICKNGALVDACRSLWVCAFQVPSLMRMFLPSGIRNTQEENFSCMLPEY